VSRAHFPTWFPPGNDLKFAQVGEAPAPRFGMAN
jgi:hypothetical protein